MSQTEENTITTPTESWTTDAIQAALADLERLMKDEGAPRAHAYLAVNAKGVRLHLDRDWLKLDSKPIPVKSVPSLFATFQAAREAIRDAMTKPDEKTIRAMALAVLDITEECGECKESALRLREFSPREIHRYHADACALAMKMGAGPFSVLLDGAIANSAGDVR